MKFTLTRTVALAAINAVQQAVSSATTIPILKNLLLQASDGILEVTGTNMDLQVRHAIPDVRIERDGAITVDAAKFRDSVASLAEGADFLFEHDRAEPLGRATLRSGRARFTLVTLPARDFPSMDDESGAAGLTIDAASMLRLFTIGGACVANDKSRAYLNGLFVHPAPSGALRVVSTDTKRLSWADKAGVEGIAGWKGVILASTTTDILTRLMRNEAPDVPITMDAGDNRVTFGIGRSTVVSKVIAGSYVPYARVVPQSLQAKMTGDTDLIAGALGRALVMMDAETQTVTLNFEPGAISFGTSSANAGELAEKVDVEYDGEPERMNVNGDNLRILLGLVRTESVVFQIAAGRSCITISETGATDMFSLMAPQQG